VRISNRTLAGGTAAVLARAHFELGQYAEAMSWADRALQIGREIGNTGSIRTGIVVGMGARLELGENPGGGRILDALDETLRQSSDFSSSGTLAVEVLLQMGELERAERFADAGTLRAGGRLRQMESLLATAHSLAAHGPTHHAEAREEFALAAAVAAEIGSRASEIAAAIGLARLQIRDGELEPAAEALSDAAEAAQSAGLGRLRDLALRALAETRGMRETDAEQIAPRLN
jgi:tetratricopeptide (TPR) repeat protein